MPVDCKLGTGVTILHPELVNIYGGDTTSIGDHSMVGPFVEIQNGVIIGARCRIQSHAFLCEGVTLEEGVFVGHGVSFINDRFPRAVTSRFEAVTKSDWKLECTRVRKGASIGSNATILCGVEIGENAIIGAGSVVTRNVPPQAIVAGNPARAVGTAPPLRD